MKLKIAMMVAAFGSLSIAGNSFGEEAPAFVTADDTGAKKNTKFQGKKNEVEESDEALSRRVDSLQKEFVRLKAELARNADARTEQTQKRIKQEMDGLEKRLGQLQVEIQKLGDASSEDIKSTVKKKVGSALTSAGDLLKKLGKEVSQ